MRQVRAGKANVSEPLLKRRKRSGVIRTGVQSLPREEPGGCLLTGQVVTGGDMRVARVRYVLLSDLRIVPLLPTTHLVPVSDTKIEVTYCAAPMLELFQ